MNFGVRFSYDFGMCMGRCFGGNMCTGADDCRVHYETFGFNPGCNNFWDMYPFPDFKTPAPGGIWYSLPLSGRCEEGSPRARGTARGASRTPAGCPWRTTSRRPDQGATTAAHPTGARRSGTASSTRDGATSDRVRSILDALEQKYPDWPRELGQGPCDFNRRRSGMPTATTSGRGQTRGPRQHPRLPVVRTRGRAARRTPWPPRTARRSPRRSTRPTRATPWLPRARRSPRSARTPEDHGSNQDDRSPKDDYSPEVTTGHATPTQEPRPALRAGRGDRRHLPPDKLPVIEEADGDGKYDCKDGLASWEDEWVLAKALWCCKHENLGCLDEFVLRKLTGSQRVQS
ncbi:unnamed protein product [Prorocentrum cordatum]|uniref:Uncharacterized protein n=1 Tax=Prorocentrum cordatum TaxID=2364126 RepID=A0ABN9TN69_9DINO|nr:unnamed protein product [Polarella glacialis]